MHLQIRTVSRFDPQLKRDVVVSRQLAGEAAPTELPLDCTVTLSTYAPQPGDRQRRYQVQERVQADGQPIKLNGPQTPIPPEALYLVEKTTLQYCGNSPAVLFQERLQDGPDDFQVKLLPGASPGERNRYTRQPGENRETVADLAAEVAQKTPASVRAWDKMLAQSRGAFLRDRYGGRRDLNILEIGPGTTGVVPRALLTPGSGNRYHALDLSPQALALQKQVLTEDGVGPLQQTVGDYADGLPVPDGSQDLVCGYASISTWGDTQDVKRYFDEFHRVLKPGGEFLMGGLGLEQASPAAIAHILDRFELIPQRETGQSVDLLLRKR